MDIKQLLLFAVIMFFFSCNDGGKKDENISYNARVVAEQKIIMGWNSLATQIERKNDLLRSLLKIDLTSPDGKKDSLRRVVNSFSLLTMHNIDNDQEIKNNIDGLITQQSEINNLILSWNKDTQASRFLFTQLEGTENRLILAIRDYNGYVEAFNSTFPDKKKNIFSTDDEFTSPGKIRITNRIEYRSV